MRQPITLKIKFKSGSLDQFIERYSVDVSRSGIFIRTKEPLAVGTQLKFEFQLQDTTGLISGEGTVVWIREHDPARTGVAPGMGVRFDKVAPASAQVLEQIIAEKQKRGEAQVESRFDAGVRATASASGTATAAKKSDPAAGFEHVDSNVMTPLPNPMPSLGFNGAEEEFGQESTRVMQDDVVQRLAQKTREAEGASALGRPPQHESFSDEPTRARSAEEIDHLLKKSADVSAPVRPKVDDKPLPAASPRPGVISSVPAPRGAAATVPNAPSPLGMPTLMGVGPEAAQKAAIEAAARAAEAATRAAEAVTGVAPSPLPSASSAKTPAGGVAAAIVPPGTDYAPSDLGQLPKTQPPAPVDARLAAAEPLSAMAMTDSETHTIARERPQARKQSSVLPVALVVGALAAIVTGYVVFSGSPNSGTTPIVTKPPEVEAKKDSPPINPPPVEKKADPPPVVEKKADPPPAGPKIAASSEPAGATITVDGKAQPSPTPTELVGLEAGKSYEVTMTLKGYREWKGKLAAKDGAKVEARLVANEKVVEVNTTPPASDLFLDGKKIGRAPYTIRKFDVVKEHQLEARHAGFVTQTRQISAGDAWESKPEGREVLALALTLEPEPKLEPKVARPVVTKKGTGKPVVDAGKPPVVVGDPPPVDKPVEKTDKPVEKTDKPVEKADKPVEKADKPVEKPVEKTDGDEKIKTPAWMKKKDPEKKDEPKADPPAEGEAK